MLKVKLKNRYGKTVRTLTGEANETAAQLCARAEEALLNDRLNINFCQLGGDDVDWDRLAIRMELVLDTRTKCKCEPWCEPGGLSDAAD